MIRKAFLSFAALALATTVASADILNTAPPNNGRSEDGAGVFVDLTATSGNLTVIEIGMVSGEPENGPVRLRVWRRTGSYVGFDGTSDGWSIVDEVDAFSAGTTNPTSFFLNNPIALAHGEVTGFLFQGLIGGVRYTGTGSGGHQTTFSDANLTLFSDVARGAPEFGGSRFSPRTFSGYINYIPAPSSLALLGLAGLACGTRRRRA